MASRMVKIEIQEEKSKKILAAFEGKLGITRTQGIALVCAIEHAANCTDFSAQYGTILRDALIKMVSEA